MADASPGNATNSQQAVFDRFQLWKEYEDVAMHFNDLIIKLRSQSLGAVAVFATLATVIIKSDIPVKLRWEVLTGAFLLLSIFWIAVWVLDLGYYNRLLAGAVAALLTIEKNSVGAKSVDRIELSTKIEETVKSGQVTNNFCRIMFYVIVCAALVGCFGFSAYDLVFVPRAAPSATDTRSLPKQTHQSN